jgi:hypothetical protein
MSSVRPLVVSQPPPIARGGGGFGRFLVGLSLVAGVSVTAYRNDLVRDGAHAAHQDALYARLESALGGPAFGTLRALEQRAAAAPVLDLGSSNEVALGAAIAPASTAATSIPTPTIGTTTTPAVSGTTTTPVVSLESLAQEKKGQQAAAPAAVTPVPVRATASLAQPKHVATPAPAPAKAAVRAAATPKAAVEKPAPVAQKPASEMSDRERLNAAIGQSMMQSTPPKAKGKSKSKGNEYDPLNPSL